MLFVSARNKSEAYTASHALQKETCADGGRFVPAKIPVVDAQQLKQWKDASFSQVVCDVLNLFYTPQLDPAEVAFEIGKRPLKLYAMSHKIQVAEVWHNSTGDFRNTVNKLVRHILGAEEIPDMPVSWARISVWIAFLFAIYVQLLQQEQLTSGCVFDVAASTADFAVPVAVWYAKEMGLPVRTVICGCDDSGALWDLCNHAAANTPSQIDPNMEHLLCSVLGQEEAAQFAAACASGKPYRISEEQSNQLKKCIFPAVVSERRLKTVIGSVYRTNSYILEPASALAFCGLLDYRVGAEETVPALMLMDLSPAHSGRLVSEALGITEKDLQRRMKLI